VGAYGKFVLSLEEIETLALLRQRLEGVSMVIHGDCSLITTRMMNALVVNYPGYFQKVEESEEKNTHHKHH